MPNMSKRSVSFRELQRHPKRILARVDRGEVVEVTRRGRLVVRLVPARTAAPVAGWPDLEARTRAVFGNRIITVRGSELVVEARGDR